MPLNRHRPTFARRLTLAAGMISVAVSNILVAAPSPALAARGGELTLRAVDASTGKPVAVRVHLKRQVGRKLITVTPPGAVHWKDHFALDGERTLKLKRGHYIFELERGPEYKDYEGHFDIDDGANDTETIEMHRFVDMKKEGWWSGDLHVHRDPREIELAMRADDLHVAPVITWWQTKSRLVEAKPPSSGLVPFDGNRFWHGRAAEDERAGGALLLLNLDGPPAFADGRAAEAQAPTGEAPSSLALVRATAQHEARHFDVEKPFWKDLPLWLASGEVDSIGVANNHLWRDGVLDNEAWGRPRDRGMYPPPHGVGRWSETIYQHVLNAGLRIAPSAGSASGVLPNPVGYNRVYVHCGGSLTYESWFEGLKAGRVVVTNGPLIRPRVDGQLPGHVFHAEAGETREFEIGLSLSTREKIEYLEIVKDGRPLHTVRLDEFVDARGRLPKVPFTESGWFLVRAVTNNQKTYRFATTGPYYVEFGYAPKVSRASCQFFLDWARERLADLEKHDFAGDGAHEGARDAVLADHRAAVAWWEKRLAEANAE